MVAGSRRTARLFFQTYCIDFSCGPCQAVFTLTCFEEDDLIVLTEVHEASDALGKLHHVVNGVGDVDGTLLPHRLCRLRRQKECN